jgi:hypothetical protein
MPLPVTADVLKSFNRDTGWLATGILGTLVIGALVLAAQVQERQPNGTAFSGQPVQVGDDHGFTKISVSENPASQIGAAAKIPALDFTPETGFRNSQLNASFPTPSKRQVTGLKVSSGRFRQAKRTKFNNVQMQLLALWHQSLIKNVRPRAWTLISSSKWDKKKVSYTAETRH